MTQAQLEKIFVTKDEFLAAFDALMYELKAIREELTIGFYRQSEHSRDVEDHEQRIKALEKKLS